MGSGRSGSTSALQPFETLVEIGAHLLYLLLELLIPHLELFDLIGKICQRALEHADSSIELSPVVAALCNGNTGDEASQHNYAAQNAVLPARGSMELHRDLPFGLGHSAVASSTIPRRLDR